jgi:rubrerythrin
MSIQLSGADLIDVAVQTEVRGETFYRGAAQAAADEPARELFTYLANEEIRHKEVFQGLSSGIIAVEVDDTSWDEAMAYIAATVDNAFFQKDAPIQAVPLADSVVGMLRQAIRFEQQTILYFYTLRDLVRAQGRGVIDRILAEERSHVRRLSTMLSERRAAEGES